MNKLLFIVGVGRSGTSLLQSMFASHSEIVYLPETSFFRRYIATGALQKKIHSRGKDGVIKLLKSDENFSRLNLNTSNLVDKAICFGGQLDAAIYSQILTHFVTKQIRLIGDKDPRLIEYLPLIKKLYPNSVVINIIRDPRDVLLSKKNALWSNKGHVWKHAFANRVQLNLGHFWGKRLFGSNYQEVIYEQLIDAPSNVLSKLCESISLPFDSAMLSFGEEAKRLTSKSEISWKKETFGPILNENKDKWKTGLNLKEILLIENVCSQAFEIGAYKNFKSNIKITILDKMWIHLGILLINILDKPYQVYRNRIVNNACKKSN
jgi:hypothetical protein